MWFKSLLGDYPHSGHKGLVPSDALMLRYWSLVGEGEMVKAFCLWIQGAAYKPEMRSADASDISYWRSRGDELTLALTWPKGINTLQRDELLQQWRDAQCQNATGLHIVPMLGLDSSRLSQSGGISEVSAEMQPFCIPTPTTHCRKSSVTSPGKQQWKILKEPCK